MFVYVLSCVVAIYVVYKLHMARLKGVFSSGIDLVGKTVLITGASRGIGYEIALDLAKRNARVILPCRNVVLGQKVVESIKSESGNTNIISKELDLSSFKSIRRLAKEIRNEEQRLDILINNAGVTAGPKKITEDGLDETYAINYYGPFLLTNLLLDLLSKSSPSRVVNVTSIAYGQGFIDFADLRGVRLTSLKYLMRSYADSKLAVILGTRQLAKRLAGIGVTVNCCHPGSVNTGLFDRMPFYVRLFIKPISAIFFRSPREGAQTPIYLSISENVQGISGRYFSECKLDNPAKKAQDDVVARKLVDATEKIVGLQS